MGLLTLSHWDSGSRNCQFCGCAVNDRTEAGRRNLALFGPPANPDPAQSTFFCILQGEWTGDFATCHDWCDPAAFNASTSPLDAAAGLGARARRQRGG